MNRKRLLLGGTALAVLCLQLTATLAAEPAPKIASLSKPQAGAMQMIFQGGSGPFQLQKRSSTEPTAPWYDVLEAKVTEINTGVFLATLPMGSEDAAFYRVKSVSAQNPDLKGWYALLQVAPPTNGLFFAKGERPVITVTLLDNYAQGKTPAEFSRLNLYLRGPEDPQKTVAAVKLLNASTNRSAPVHHYIDLKTNPDAQVSNNVITYRLQPVTDEAPGTYVASLWIALASDNLQQIMPSTSLQIGTATVETPVVTKMESCSACHAGPVSGKMYMHHIDPGFSPTGNWALDYEPVNSCKACHNNDGYAAFTDLSVPGVTNRVSDAIVIRAHGVHMGEHLKLPANTNEVNGIFKEYTEVVFPAGVTDCTKCHVDDRWKTAPSRQACVSCHDTIWFGAADKTPPFMVNHPMGPASNDTRCSVCHPAEGSRDEFTAPIATVHKAEVQITNKITVTLTAPANGKYYVAGEKPVATLVFYDDTGTTPIDHTKVTDANFSTASFFAYGPRALAKPVLTSAAKYGNSKLRASVASSIAGPWPINGKTFKISVNRSAPQEILIQGASNLVTAAEVVASLNAVITNYNAKATVSGANVNMRTTVQGDAARFEIYSGDVTTAMGWKRGPKTTMDPDITIAQGYTQANDLRGLSDPLDFSDPMVTRTAGNIQYQLDDVAGLTPGTYFIYVYHIPKAGKIANLTASTGIGFTTFQVGTATVEKKIATNCTECHSQELFHFTGNIHAEPINTDWCVACHDYNNLTTGEMFKNQGGTSLSGWSGFGAMPISRRVHGIHYAHYLEHPEEIYANATKDTFGGIIFPVDVRNCTMCHAETTTWKEKPSRIACLGCHDSDSAKFHGTLMTYFKDANDPYGPGSYETCESCHGAGREFSADKVHRISNPYVPPYPRAGGE